MFDVLSALRDLVAKEGSDLHLKVGAAPLFRVHGDLAHDSGADDLTSDVSPRCWKALILKRATPSIS